MRYLLVGISPHVDQGSVDQINSSGGYDGHNDDEYSHAQHRLRDIGVPQTEVKQNSRLSGWGQVQVNGRSERGNYEAERIQVPPLLRGPDG